MSIISGAPERLEYAQHQKARSVVDVLCSTAATIGLFETATRNADIMRTTGFAPAAYSHAAFNSVVGEIFTWATVTLHEIGGLPLTFKDEVTAEHRTAAAYIISGYSSGEDRWILQATQYGQPPMNGMPVLQISTTTPELREAHEEAMRAASFVRTATLHPGQP